MTVSPEDLIQAALVLNASHRFRYTLDLKREEEKTQTIRKIRAHAQALRAAELFKEAGVRVNGVKFGGIFKWDLEIYLARQANKVYVNLKGNMPHIVNTGWAMMALISVGQVNLFVDHSHVMEFECLHGRNLGKDHAYILGPFSYFLF